MLAGKDWKDFQSCLSRCGLFGTKTCSFQLLMEAINLNIACNNLYNILLLHLIAVFSSFANMPEVDCSGERLSVCRKNLRILKTFSSYSLLKIGKIP
jgi:hypothetical protein